MAPTLRSDRQLESSPVTRPASPQVMSPIRAQDSTDVSAGVNSADSRDHAEVSTNQGQGSHLLAGNATGGDDAPLSHSEVEHLIRSLAQISDGQPLIRRLLEGMQNILSAEEPIRNQSTPRASERGDGTRVNERWREEAGMDNTFPGGRYDDRELAEYTKALRNSPDIQLPKLVTKADYKAWRSEVPLHFEPRTLGAITYGGERFDAALGYQRPKYHEWYSARKNKAFSALALSLSVDLRSTFKIDEMRDNMEAASILWSFITKHFEAGDGINPDYLMRDLMTRMLQTNESVTAYVDAIERKVTMLRQAKGEFEEWQHASLLLSNAVLVFRDLAREHANWINSNDRKSLKLAEALQRLRSAEHQRNQLELQSKPAATVSRPMQVAQVAAGHNNNNRKRGKLQRKRLKAVADKKQRTQCANCSGDGHWYAECTERTGKPLKPELARKLEEKRQGRRPPASLVGSVRRVQVVQGETGAQGLVAGLSLCAPGAQETVDLTTSGSSDAVASPVYSPTTPASPVDDDQAAHSPSLPTVATSASSQQLELEEKAPAPPVQADTAVQQAVQTLVTDAVRRQWEGVQSQGQAATWQQVLQRMSQTLKSVSNVEPLLEPTHNKGGSQGGPLVHGDSIQGIHSETHRSQGPNQNYGNQMQLSSYQQGRQQGHEMRGRWPLRQEPYNRGRSRSPPPMQGWRGRSPPRGRSDIPPWGPSRRGPSPPRWGRRSCSPSRGPPSRYGPQPRQQWRDGPPNRNHSPPRQQWRDGTPSHYGPQPHQQQQWRDEPPRESGPSPYRGGGRDEPFRRDVSPRGREGSPRRLAGPPRDGSPRSWQVNAVGRNQGMQSDACDSVEWILDSGSQANVCGDLALFTTIREDSTSRLDFANGTTEHASVCGSVLLRVMNQATGMMEDRLLDDVVYTPNAKVNIISLGYLQMTGQYKLTCSHDQRTAWMSKPGTILKFAMHENIYRLRTERVPGVMVMAALKQDFDSKKSMELLHQRFGHASMETVRVLSNKLDVGVKMNANGLSSYECLACAASKSKRMTYTRIPVRKSKPLETLMMDICTVNEPTVGGAIMFLLIIDEATRYKWAYLLEKKSDATWHIKVLLNQLKTKLPKLAVQRLRSDQGGEFASTELVNYCAENGIEQQFTNTYSPQENGIVERANGIVMPRVRVMLSATNLPNLLWGEALLHIVATLNRLPTKPLGLATPIQKLFRSAPDVDELRVWGCIAHVRVPPESRQKKEKLQPRARLSLLLGYSDSTVGYKFLDLATAQVVTARGGNVRFHEEFTADGTNVKQLLENAFHDGDHQLPETVPVARIKTSMETYLPGKEDVGTAQQLEVLPIADATAENVQSSSGSASTAASPVTTDSATDDGATADSVELQPGVAAPAAVQKPAEGPPAATKAKKKRKRRARKKPTSSEEEVTGFEIQQPPVEPCQKRPRRTQKQSVRLRDYVVGHVLATGMDVEIPTTYKQARRSKHWLQWKAAMLAELQSLKGHKTWKLVPRAAAKGVKVITCRWVFAVKRDERGRIKRFKARLVIHGFKQRLGVDYRETYAPVIRFETIRAAIYFAVQRGWEVLQYDVKTAFLYGDLEELIFMEQPPGFQVDGPGFVCRLLKSLYGLKQAPNIWNKTLHAKLMTMGFERMNSDYGLYALKENGEVRLLLTVYVDNLLLMGPRELCTEVATSLQKTFELTTMGAVKYLLGVEILINRPRREIVYCQRQYVLEILKRFHMTDCNGCATPESATPSTAAVTTTKEYLPYRELVGALQYLVSASRPDIAHATRHLGKFLANYNHSHFAQAKRVLRYLKATSDYGLVMDVQPGTSVLICSYSDADYANDPVDRRSISGYVTMLDANVISYASRKQEINALSTCEAEYVAMSEATKDLLWLVGLCKELAWVHPMPLLLGDNEGAISLSTKPGKHSKSKHIDNKYHMVRRNVELKKFTTQHVGTEDMVADTMTKALAVVKFTRFRKAMKVLPIVAKDPTDSKDASDTKDCEDNTATLNEARASTTTDTVAVRHH